MKLYHFMSTNYGISAIRDHRYKLSTYDNLNDPFELYATDHSDPMIRECFRKVKEMYIKDTALLCCSKSWHSTLLWSHYADKHSGVALELDVTDSSVTEVVYRSARTPTTREDMDAYMECEDGEGIGKEMIRVKSLEWSYENEARVLYDITKVTPTEGRYFMPFDANISLSGIILGPLCKIRIEEIEAAMASETELLVRKARIAFRSFRVVTDLSFKPVRLAVT